MDFPESVAPVQSAASTFSEPMPDRMIDEPRMEESSPVAMANVGPDVISLDAMRSAMVANFEQADLDVPAFLRKRGEVM